MGATTWTLWAGTRVVGEYGSRAEAEAALRLYAGATGCSPQGERYWLSQG